jgi:predicted DNA-binding protein with PD1-like motif
MFEIKINLQLFADAGTLVNATGNYVNAHTGAVTAFDGVNTMNGEFYCHVHMSAGDDKGRVVGGHLNRAVVSATCEMVVTCIPGSVDRAFSEEVGLNLFKF